MKFNPPASRALDLLPSSVLPLKEQVELLRETVRVYQEALTPVFTLPTAWGLTETHERLLCALRAVGPGLLVRDRALLALYGCSDDAPSYNVIEVFICKLRRLLAAADTGIVIETAWGRGWRMTAESCARFDAAVAADRAAYGEAPSISPRLAQKAA